MNKVKHPIFTFIAVISVIMLLYPDLVNAKYTCKMTCQVCQNQKTACPDTPNRQMDGHNKKMHECGQDCCLHVYLGDLQTRHTSRLQHQDHREVPEYDSKQNINGKKPECKGEDDCCHNVYDVADAQMKALEADPSCDTEEGKPRCDAQCQQINSQCDQGEQRCQSQAKQTKQQYQQQKKGDETHDQELNECFDRFQKTVEVEKNKQYDLTTPQVNEILDKKNKIEYVRDDRTSGEHECERMPLDDGNKYKNENIESFDEGKKKILQDTSDDILRKQPQDEFMTPECIAKTMHEKQKLRLSEQVFNAQCRADEEPDKNCPISADVVLNRQSELNNQRHKSNIESAKQKTDSMQKESSQTPKTDQTSQTAQTSQTTKTDQTSQTTLTSQTDQKTTDNNDSKDTNPKNDEIINADLDYLYFYDKEVSKNFEIKDKNPHRVARIRKNKEGKPLTMDKAPEDNSISPIFETAKKKLENLPLGMKEVPLFLANCGTKSVALKGSHALFGWQCQQPAQINPVQRQEAEKRVQDAQKKVFFSDHWQSEQGKINVITDQPYTKPIFYTGAYQYYRDLISQYDDVWFGGSIHIINKKNNMFTLDGWLNNGVIDHLLYYRISLGGKTLHSFASPVGEFIEDSHSRFLWIGPGTTEYLGDFYDRYATNTNMWHFQSQVYVQQPDFRGKQKLVQDPPNHKLILTFDRRRFNQQNGIDITATSQSWMTLLPKGFFDIGLVSDMAGIFPALLRGYALGDSDIVYNPGVELKKTYTVRDEKDYLYAIRSYDESTKVHTAKNKIIEDSASKPITSLSTREKRLIYELRNNP